MAKFITRKGSVEANDNIYSESNSVNAYGVRYVPNSTNSASGCRFSRSTNPTVPCNATVNLTRRGFSLRSSSAFSNQHERLKDILKKNWNVYSASSFYSFEPSPEHLAHYCKLLNENISAVTKETRKTARVSSKFNYYSGCPSILGIQIYSSFAPKKDVKANETKVVYEGHFFSWDDKRGGVNDENDSMNEDGMRLSMPLFLCQSSNGEQFIKVVHSCLMKMFDIVISSVVFSQEDMAWLTSLASSDPDESWTATEATPEVHYFYSIPNLTQKKDKPIISMSYELELIHEMWKCVHQHDGAADEILIEEVLTFVRALEENALCTYGVNLSECCLTKVVMPSTSFGDNGKIKISSLVIAGRLLRFLADMCALDPDVISLGFSVSLRKV